MSIAVLIMTDGRDDLLAKTVTSWAPVLDHPLIAERYIHDDTGDDVHRKSIAETYGFTVLGGGRRRGYAQSIAFAWRHLGRDSKVDHVLHVEDDMLLIRQFDPAALVEVLDRNPHLVQMALRRTACYPHEIAAGGVVEVQPTAWTDVTDGTHRWLERPRFWTCNPCLYRRSLTGRGWPDHRTFGPESETRFAGSLKGWERSGYWGGRDEAPHVEHIGVERVGHGY